MMIHDDWFILFFHLKDYLGSFTIFSTSGFSEAKHAFFKICMPQRYINVLIPVGEHNNNKLLFYEIISHLKECTFCELCFFYTLQMYEQNIRAIKKDTGISLCQFINSISTRLLYRPKKQASSKRTYLIHRYSHCWKQWWKSYFGIFLKAAMLILMSSTESKLLLFNPFWS